MPDFIAVDEINSQVVSSESNIKSHVDAQTMSVTSRIGVSESNIKTAFNNKGVIRHIQRGTFSLDYRYSSSGNKYWDDANVTLNGFINLDKMIVLIDGNGEYANQPFVCYLKSITTTKATFSCAWCDWRIEDSVNYGGFSYQVIEFY